MKKSELRQIVKEEYKKVLNEGYSAEDRNILIKEFVDSVHHLEDGHRNKSNIMSIQQTGNDTIKVDLSFETIMLKITSVKEK